LAADVVTAVTSYEGFAWTSGAITLWQ